ncbi:MAG: TraR/DksA C4-type zinc finger protein, partial [Deltaproteobacteria bacterium]|nr:TraR/DksA C4-type zinc finger protein [Deltaproteobacteria bacterium]
KTTKQSTTKKSTTKKADGAKKTAKKPTAKKPAKKTIKKEIGFKASENGPFISADPDAKLSQSQVKGLYEKLITERNRVIEGVKRHVGEAVEDQDRLPDDVDLASRHADQAFLLRFADKEHKLLRQINLALSKLEIGEYGVCEGTGEPIGFARLKIRPWTRYSVQYKEELERRRAHEKR